MSALTRIKIKVVTNVHTEPRPYRNVRFGLWVVASILRNRNRYYVPYINPSHWCALSHVHLQESKWKLHDTEKSLPGGRFFLDRGNPFSPFLAHASFRVGPFSLPSVLCVTGDYYVLGSFEITATAEGHCIWLEVLMRNNSKEEKSDGGESKRRIIEVWLFTKWTVPAQTATGSHVVSQITCNLHNEESPLITIIK